MYPKHYHFGRRNCPENTRFCSNPRVGTEPQRGQGRVILSVQPVLPHTPSPAASARPPTLPRAGGKASPKQQDQPRRPLPSTQHPPAAPEQPRFPVGSAPSPGRPSSPEPLALCRERRETRAASRCLRTQIKGEAAAVEITKTKPGEHLRPNEPRRSRQGPAGADLAVLFTRSTHTTAAPVTGDRDPNVPRSPPAYFPTNRLWKRTGSSRPGRRRGTTQAAGRNKALGAAKHPLLFHRQSCAKRRQLCPAGHAGVPRAGNGNPKTNHPNEPKQGLF